MPTQKNLGVSPSVKGTKTAAQSGTLVQEALAVAKSSIPVMPTLTNGEMSKSEALAVAWTGIEALAHQKQAILYLSPKGGRVLIELLAVSYDPANGLVEVLAESETK